MYIEYPPERKLNINTTPGQLLSSLLPSAAHLELVHEGHLGEQVFGLLPVGLAAEQYAYRFHGVSHHLWHGTTTKNDAVSC